MLKTTVARQFYMVAPKIKTRDFLKNVFIFYFRKLIIYFFYLLLINFTNFVKHFFKFSWLGAESHGQSREVRRYWETNTLSVLSLCMGFVDSKKQNNAVLFCQVYYFVIFFGHLKSSTTRWQSLLWKSLHEVDMKF